MLQVSQTVSLLKYYIPYCLFVEYTRYDVNLITYGSPFLMEITWCHLNTIANHIRYLQNKCSCYNSLCCALQISHWSLIYRCLCVHLVISLGHISCRLYTEEYYLNEMQPEGIPEMQRSNLVSCVIQVPWFVCFLFLLVISLHINAVN